MVGIYAWIVAELDGMDSYRNLVREEKMTPAQKEIYLVIDEWWKRFGFGPTIDDVMRLTGDKGRGNVARKMKALVKLGVCKGLPGRARSIRPTYIRVHKID